MKFLLSITALVLLAGILTVPAYAEPTPEIIPTNSTFSIATPSDKPILTMSQQWLPYGTKLIGELNGYNLPSRTTAIIDVGFPDDRAPMHFEIPVTQAGVINMPWLFSIYNPQGTYHIVLDTIQYVIECDVVFDGNTLQTDTCDISKIKKNGDIKNTTTTPVYDTNTDSTSGSNGGDSGSSSGNTTSSSGNSGDYATYSNKNLYMALSEITAELAKR